MKNFTFETINGSVNMSGKSVEIMGHTINTIPVKLKKKIKGVSIVYMVSRSQLHEVLNSVLGLNKSADSIGELAIMLEKQLNKF